MHVASRARSLVAFVEGALRVELTYRTRDGRKGATPTSVSVKPGPAVRAVAASSGAWTTYADLIPFEGCFILEWQSCFSGLIKVREFVRVLPKATPPAFKTFRM